MKNVRPRFWIIQYRVLAVLLFLGATGALIVAIRNVYSLTSFVFFLVIMGICLLLSIVSIYCAVKRA